MKTQMKCRKMRQFIRVLTVCQDKIDVQWKKCKKKCLNCEPSIYTMDHSAFIVCSFMEISIGNATLIHLRISLRTYCVSGITKNATASLATALTGNVADTQPQSPRSRSCSVTATMLWPSKQFKICCTFPSRFLNV